MRSAALKTEQPILLFLTFAVFLAAKLFGAIDWSWWYVTAPLWIYPLATFSVGIIAGLYLGLKLRRLLRESSWGKGGEKVGPPRR